MNPKLLLVMLLLILSLGLMACTSSQNNSRSDQTNQATPPTTTSTDQIDQWQTYSNHQYKFSFKYHPSWQLRTETESDNGLSLALTRGREIIAVRMENHYLIMMVRIMRSVLPLV